MHLNSLKQVHTPGAPPPGAWDDIATVKARHEELLKLEWLQELNATEQRATGKRKRTASAPAQQPAVKAPAAAASPTATASAGKKVAQAPAAAGCSTIVLQDQSDEEEDESEESDVAPARSRPTYENEEESSDGEEQARVPAKEDKADKKRRIKGSRPSRAHAPLARFIERYGASDDTIGTIWEIMKGNPHCAPHPNPTTKADKRKVFPTQELCEALDMGKFDKNNNVIYPIVDTGVPECTLWNALVKVAMN